MDLKLDFLLDLVKVLYSCQRGNGLNVQKSRDFEEGRSSAQSHSGKQSRVTVR